MANDVITLRGISKAYRKNQVLSDYNLSVKKGHICGLIGPNGIGKTTIIKIIAGWTAQDSGELFLFGDSEKTDDSRHRMSFLIERPNCMPCWSARQNLEYMRYLSGYPDEKRIDEVLEIVGLKDAGNKKFSKFSLGMQQRLGIAMALLSQPEVLVLDEPINGMDPEGIVDIRNLILKMKREWGTTVLISSHILTEMTELCTDYSIIRPNRAFENVSAEELFAKCCGYIAVRTDDICRTTAVLESELKIHKYKVVRNEEIHILERMDELPVISRTLTDNGLTITKLVEQKQNLEDYYLGKEGSI